MMSLSRTLTMRRPLTALAAAPEPWAWYSARAVSGQGVALPADGTSLTQWNDLSGNGRHLTGTAGRQLFRTASPNLMRYDASLSLLSGAAAASANGGVTPTLTQGGAIAGTAAAHSVVATVTTAGAPGGGARVVLNPVATGRVPVTAGSTIGVEAAIDVTSIGTGSWQLYVEYYSAAGAWLTSLLVSSGSSTTGTATVRGTQTVPATATQAHLLLQGSDLPANGSFAVGAAGVYEGGLPAAWLPAVTLPSVAGTTMPGVQMYAASHDLGRSVDTTALNGPLTAVVVASQLAPTPANNWPRLWHVNLTSASVPGRSEVTLIGYGSGGNLSQERWRAGVSTTAPSIPASAAGVPFVHATRTDGATTAQVSLNNGTRSVSSISAAHPADAGASGAVHIGTTSMTKHFVVHELALYGRELDDGTLARVMRTLAAPYAVPLEG